MLPSRLSENKEPKLVRVLISRLFELEKLQENRLIAQDIIIFN
jgi:hypothetical protein